MQEPDSTARFALMRQDDNGNIFEITRVCSEARAEALVAGFTARGHKQLYWVERVEQAGGPKSHG